MDWSFIIFVFLVIGALCIVELPKMIHKPQKKELWTFSILIGIVTLLTLAKGFGLQIPNPSYIVMKVYEPITNSMKNVFK